MILNKWIKCSEDNYWINEPGYITIIKINDEVYIKNNCPYGWNILIKNNGYLMNIKL